MKNIYQEYKLNQKFKFLEITFQLTRGYLCNLNIAVGSLAPFFGKIIENALALD